jgi:hypothetical protein
VIGKAPSGQPDIKISLYQMDQLVRIKDSPGTKARSGKATV